MKQIKAIQIGCGKMSKYIMQYIYDLGGTIEAAFDIDSNLIGKDISTIIDTEKKGIIINDISKLDEVLESIKPDIAIITTCSFARDLEDTIRTCVTNNVNVITTCEECFYLENSNPNLYKALDILAKTNNVTITGCGYQDVFWGNLITTLASSHHNIKKIRGRSSYNVEDYGEALARAHGVGLSLEDFNKVIVHPTEMSKDHLHKLIDSGNFNPSYMWNTCGWIASKLNLTPTNISEKRVPTTANKIIHSNTLNINIEPKHATGMSAIVTLETKEGITIEAECIGKVYSKEDTNIDEWTIYSDCDTTLTINNPDTVRLTCSDIVDRIPDVIDSVPGFIPTSQMPEPKYIIKY